MKTMPIHNLQKRKIRGVVAEGKSWGGGGGEMEFKGFFFFENVRDFEKQGFLRSLLCGGLKFLHLSTKRPEK